MKEIFPHIIIDPNIQSGKPVIAGTRVPVELIVGHIAAGMDIREVCTEYDLKPADVKAALTHASNQVRQESLISVG